MPHVCRLLQSDFTDGTGRYDEYGEELYDEYNLECAAVYAEDYLEVGIKRDPLYGFSLAGFAAFCRAKLATRAE